MKKIIKVRKTISMILILFGILGMGIFFTYSILSYGNNTPSVLVDNIYYNSFILTLNFVSFWFWIIFSYEVKIKSLHEKYSKITNLISLFCFTIFLLGIQFIPESNRQTQLLDHFFMDLWVCSWLTYDFIDFLIPKRLLVIKS